LLLLGQTLLLLLLLLVRVVAMRSVCFLRGLVVVVDEKVTEHDTLLHGRLLL